MGFFQNLLGTISQESGLDRYSANTDFIPANGNDDIINFSGNNASEWLGLENASEQKKAYDFCYPLASVIDRLAEADINGNIEILRATGKGTDNYATNDFAKRMNKLLANPNPAQSWEEFRGQQVVYKKICGFCPVLPILPEGFTDPSEALALINLPPWLFFAELDRNNGNVIPKVFQYSCKILNNQIKLKPEQVLILADGFVMDDRRSHLLPKSKMVGLDMAISNLMAGMEADNVLLRKRGPLGFISHDSAAVKDSVAGYVPMTRKETDELQGALSRYGLSWSQYQYAISRQAVKWNPMSFNVKELGTKETILQGEKAVCKRYNYDYVLFENTDASYANGNTAAKALYQNNIVPNNYKDIKKYNSYFNFFVNNCKLNSDYSHLAVMQEDAEMQGRAKQYANVGLQIEWLNGVITLNQWRIINGYDTTDDGEIYYPEYRKINPATAPVAGTVPAENLPAGAGR